jgi:hypothetical protein
METRWVNWDWMANKRHTIFNQIKATCDELEMTKMMSFKYVTPRVSNPYDYVNPMFKRPQVLMNFKV